MIMIVCMLFASVFFALFSFLLLTAGKDQWKALLTCMRETEEEKQKDIQMEMTLLVDQVKRTKNAKDKTVVKKANKLRKQMEQSKKLEEQIEAGKISVLDIFPLAGYRLLGILKWDSKQDIYVKLYHKCMQFKEEKEAKHYTEYLLASLASCLLLAAFSLFAGCAIGLAAGMGTRSIVLGVVVMAIFVLVGYVPYDNVSVMINKRAEEIEWQFPQVMSQMTLLVVAGMEVRQAWELSAKSGSGTLYEEMRRVLVGLENNEMPVDVYGRFIRRCDNSYTNKLATAILQNSTKGNAEIVELFRTMNEESWSEHKHNARRQSEKIQSKLMLPTLLMFGGILILIIVPIVTGFNF